ncbi:MAG: DUF2252 domain-containing protein [Acidimicrobiia bacterium]|nr:DUF2252 domain-containing protein [Acidimicrobiia bacterium]
MTTVIGPDATAAEFAAAGRKRRDQLGRGAHATFACSGRDPVSILEEQHVDRLAGLVPVRIGRMLQSPFAYYRGSAAVMAHDLSSEQVTGHQPMICGDAHILNFGLFASPERRVLFDLNDFDESSLGPWEWDVKRMAASVHIGARDKGLTEVQATEATTQAVAAYRGTMAALCERTVLERYYFQVDTDWLQNVMTSDDQKMLHRSVRKASNRTSQRVLDKITTTSADGQVAIVDQPPIMVHIDELSMEFAEELFDQYRTSVRADVGVLLSQFRLVDSVLRVVGVGSVGTRCFVALLLGPDDEPLFLQIKEAPASVLQTYGGVPAALPPTVPPVPDGHEGHRVVSAQRILQAQSDPFLGWIVSAAGKGMVEREVDYYVRQFRDMKGSVQLDALSVSQYADYCGLCGSLLARAHSQSPGAAFIAAYLGTSDKFDRAVASWSVAYADQIEQDYARLQRAVRENRLPAATEV